MLNIKLFEEANTTDGNVKSKYKKNNKDLIYVVQQYRKYVNIFKDINNGDNPLNRDMKLLDIEKTYYIYRDEGITAFNGFVRALINKMYFNSSNKRYQIDLPLEDVCNEFIIMLDEWLTNHCNRDSFEDKQVVKYILSHCSQAFFRTISKKRLCADLIYEKGGKLDNTVWTGSGGVILYMTGSDKSELDNIDFEKVFIHYDDKDIDYPYLEKLIGESDVLYLKSIFGNNYIEAGLSYISNSNDKYQSDRNKIINTKKNISIEGELFKIEEKFNNNKNLKIRSIFKELGKYLIHEPM